MKPLALIAFLSLSAPVLWAQSAELREFANQQGVKIKARLIGVAGGQVTIVREDGRQYTLPLASLSAADQEYVRKTPAVAPPSASSPPVAAPTKAGPNDKLAPEKKAMRASGFMRNGCVAKETTAVGWSAGYNTNGSDNIVIGNLGVPNENATIRIGTQGRHTSAFMSGIHGATAASGVGVFVNNQGKLGTLTSSKKFKTDIASMDSASNVLLSLRPVTFKYKLELDSEGVPQFGLIAEEVAEVCPDLIARDGDGEIYTVRYEAVNAMLLNEFIKQDKHLKDEAGAVAQQERKLTQQENTIDKQQKQIEDLTKQLGELTALAEQMKLRID